MKETIRYGSQSITFELRYRARQTLGITVTPSLDIIVSAPHDTPLDKIKEKVHKRASWILKQMEFFQNFLPLMPAKRYVGGETHLYLGRQYRLRIIPSTTGSVKLKGAFIEVHTPTPEQTKDLVQAWYLQRARTKLPEIAQRCVARFEKYGVSPSVIQIRQMSHRWGSCTSQGKILLNPTLIKAPTGCIEYVVVHELCHLIHPHHTARFFRLQSQEFPHWQKWKDKLERLLAAE